MCLSSFFKYGNLEKHRLKREIFQVFFSLSPFLVCMCSYLTVPDREKNVYEDVFFLISVMVYLRTVPYGGETCLG